MRVIMTLGELARAGGVRGLEQEAAAEAIKETRKDWLPALEILAAKPDLDLRTQAYLALEIRRLRRALRLPPPPLAPPSAEAQQRRREQTRARVRRYRARRKNGQG